MFEVQIEEAHQTVKEYVETFLERDSPLQLIDGD